LRLLQQALAKFDLPGFTSGLALSLSLDGPLNYKTLREVAEGVVAICHSSESHSSRLYLALDVDVAKSLGGILKEELKLDREVIVIDGIEVGDLDYIDIGIPIGITEVIPVNWAHHTAEPYPVLQPIFVVSYSNVRSKREEKPCQPGQARNTLRGCGNAPLRSTSVGSR
jgi:hypothetical protein